MSKSIKSIRETILDILEADLTLIALLGNGANGIHHVAPPKALKPPAILYRISNATNHEIADPSGKVEKAIELNFRVLGTNVAVLDDIVGRVEELLHLVNLSGAVWQIPCQFVHVSTTEAWYPDRAEGQQPLIEQLSIFRFYAREL